jgi:hypothetical protein
MRDYVFINEDGTVNNILHLTGPEAIAENEDLKDLLHFDYTDWAYDDKPAPDSIYNKETEVWTKPIPFTSSVVVENLVPLTEPVAATPIEEPESNILGGQE